MLIGVDFDDVIYPYHRFLKEKIKVKLGIDLSKERITSFYYENHAALREKGVTRTEVWRLVQETWEDVDHHARAELLDPGIPAAIAKLRKRHKVVLVTARHQASRPHVEAFLKRFGVQVDEVRVDVDPKSGFDVLIDDFPRHAQENALSGGWSILYTIDENTNYDETKEPRIWRVNSWKEVADAVARIEEMREHA